MKVCKRCGLEKHEAAFSKCRQNPDGLYHICRDCRSEKYYENYERNNEIRKKCKAKRQVAGRSSRSVLKYRKHNKDRARAFMLVQCAIRRGALDKPAYCPRCGSTIRIQAHHEDYSKPEEVDWMCQKCHSALHRQKDIAATIALSR